MVYKLSKALYGLKQAPRSWYEKLDGYLNSQGFHRSSTEHNLYKKINKKGEILLVCVYVDDVIYEFINGVDVEFQGLYICNILLK